MSPAVILQEVGISCKISGYPLGDVSIDALRHLTHVIWKTRIDIREEHGRVYESLTMTAAALSVLPDYTASDSIKQVNSISHNTSKFKLSCYVLQPITSLEL